MKDLKREKRGILLLVTVCFVLMSVLTACSSGGPDVLTGRISDAYSGVPLQGVTVQVKGTDTKVETAQDGTYSLNLPKDAKTIILSLTGYKTLEIQVQGRTEIYAVLSQTSASNPLWEG